MAEKKNTTKTSKTKTSKTKTSEQESFASKFSSKVDAIVVTHKFKLACLIILSVILAFCLCLGLALGIRSCVGVNGILSKKAVTVNKFAQTTLVGYSAQTLGTVDRYKPVADIGDERDLFPLGIDVDENYRYPKYGSTMNSVVGTDPDGSKTAARNALINESSYLTATGTANAGGGGYTWMDENGYLYSGTRHSDPNENTPAYYPNTTIQRQLYKHTASVGLYLGDVKDTEPGIIKQVTLRPRGYSSYSVTGVYACAGEVIKIEISDADMTATGGIVIHIGQALYNGQANNIWADKGQMQRIPHLLNTMSVTKNTAYFDENTQMWTAYVGSFIGGPLYVRTTSATVTVKISGGVAYSHFILGYTTPEEFAEVSKSTAPYFDLEVWDRGVLHSGPVTYAKSFSYDDLYNAAILWEKVSLVANYNGDGNPGNQGIVFLYDPFVAAGAAVAFPGRCSVNCPVGWMSSSLNYNSIVTSGSWGNFHEYHHNFQNYGIGYTGEVTNNGLNLVAYSLFTNISAARQLANYGGAGLSGWNCYTSATWAQAQVMANNINSTSGLAVYATLLHNFGQEEFLNARGHFGADYFNRWAEITHYDFSYFDQNTTVYSGGPLNPTPTDYPLFVPVSSVYQTGRSYYYDNEKRYIETMQPYVIPYGKAFTVDLNPYTLNAGGQYESGSILVGAGPNEDFTYKIKSVKTSGINGKFKKTGDGIYTFTPNKELRSGKIYVTLEIYNKADGKKYWNGHELKDVELVLEFQQSHEWNKTILERTIYTYSADKMYADAQTAYESGFKGYSKVTDISEHSNPVQNSNTDIWLYPDTESQHTAHPDVPDYYFAAENRIDVVDGKLYFKEDGKFRIYMRGRYNCALYFSLDGKNYTLGAKINDTNATDQFRLTDPNSYFDIEFDEGKCTVWVYVGNEKAKEYNFDITGDNWLYFKDVLIIENSTGRASYVGLGFAEWTVPLYTTQVKYYDSNGNEVNENSEDIARTETLYFDASGKQVSAEQASDVTPIEPTKATYATAYRRDYEFQSAFTSDYFYLRKYNYNYDDKVTGSAKLELVSVSHDPWDSSRAIDYLLDRKTNTTYHSAAGGANYISESRPFELVVNLGETLKVNHVTFYGYHYDGNFKNNGMPVTFTLYGSLDGVEFFELFSRENMEYDAFNITFEFDAVEIHYYKLFVTLTDNGKYFAMNEIEFFYQTVTLTGNGNNLFSPDDKMFTYKGNWTTESGNATFGHVNIGTKGTVEFEFEGTRLGIIASALYGKNYIVYIDGKIVESIDVLITDAPYSVAYLSPELKDRKHKVVIYCKDEGNIDSIVIW